MLLHRLRRCRCRRTGLASTQHVCRIMCTVAGWTLEPNSPGKNRGVISKLNNVSATDRKSGGGLVPAYHIILQIAVARRSTCSCSCACPLLLLLLWTPACVTRTENKLKAERSSNTCRVFPSAASCKLGAGWYKQTPIALPDLK